MLGVRAAAAAASASSRRPARSASRRLRTSRDASRASRRADVAGSTPTPGLDQRALDGVDVEQFAGDTATDRRARPARGDGFRRCRRRAGSPIPPHGAGDRRISFTALAAIAGERRILRAHQRLADTDRRRPNRATAAPWCARNRRSAARPAADCDSCARVAQIGQRVLVAPGAFDLRRHRCRTRAPARSDRAPDWRARCPPPASAHGRTIPTGDARAPARRRRGAACTAPAGIRRQRSIEAGHRLLTM